MRGNKPARPEAAPRHEAKTRLSLWKPSAEPCAQGEADGAALAFPGGARVARAEHKRDSCPKMLLKKGARAAPILSPSPWCPKARSATWLASRSNLGPAALQLSPESHWRIRCSVQDFDLTAEAFQELLGHFEERSLTAEHCRAVPRLAGPGRAFTRG